MDATLAFVIENITEYSSFFINKDISFVAKRYQQPNLLFRPIGQTLLAKIYKYFKINNDLDYLSNNINKLDFSLPGIHFDRVAWNDGRMETKYQNVAYSLTLYLLNRLTEEEINRDGGLTAQFKMATKESRSLPDKVV